MKKIRYFILAILLLFSILGCSKQQSSETDMTSADMVAVIEKSQSKIPTLKQITVEDADFATWLSDYYCVQTEKVENGTICYADGVEASEIAVLLMVDEKDCKVAEERLNEYIQSRASVFEGYAPQQAAMAKKGIVVANGRYIALMICPQPQTAREVFLDCFGKTAENIESGSSTDGGHNKKDKTGIGKKSTLVSDSETEEMSEDVREDDFYNEEAVLQAWESGDDSSLSDRNRSILDAAKNIIESEIDNNMSDYEKELAIHDFITNWSRFDYSVFGRSSAEGFEDGSDTPYGVLIEQSAMCHGYSATFQLFMDMLNIECMTVFGVPDGNGMEHSWNMVKLDGEWYCVDCAWDDPIGGSPEHTYFNVTSDYLRSGSIHRWDEASVPEATGIAYAYGK